MTRERWQEKQSGSKVAGGMVFSMLLFSFSLLEFAMPSTAKAKWYETEPRIQDIRKGCTKGLFSVAKAPLKALHNVAQLYSDNATLLEQSQGRILPRAMYPLYLVEITITINSRIFEYSILGIDDI